MRFRKLKAIWGTPVVMPKYWQRQSLPEQFLIEFGCDSHSTARAILHNTNLRRMSDDVAPTTRLDGAPEER